MPTFVYFFILCFSLNLLHTQEPQVTNSIGMELVYIPPGTFIMGSPYDADMHQSDETPHEVRLTNGFYMSATEVTQAQWQEVMGVNRSYFQGDSLPAEKMSWKEAVQFCERLSEREGNVYRLPTEAEWEYACRAGTNKSPELLEVGWMAMNSGDQTHPVAQKPANAWGLYDMHGNVAEWCSDWYEPDYGEEAKDPTGPEEGTVKVIRGGGYDSFPPGCRCAARMSGPPGYKYTNTGFRVVLEVKNE